MLPEVINKLRALAKKEPRFKLLEGLTKEEYYTELATCSIQFNSSLQDYVSWTVIEATAFGADIIYPKFRSFPEFIDEDRMYKPFDVQSALNTFLTQCYFAHRHNNIVDISDLGRQMEGYIIANGIKNEINVWHETEYCKHLLNKNEE